MKNQKLMNKFRKLTKKKLKKKKLNMKIKSSSGIMKKRKKMKDLIKDRINLIKMKKRTHSTKVLLWMINAMTNNQMNKCNRKLKLIFSRKTIKIIKTLRK